nr:metallopeptidase family protein [Arsenicicoccus piscis]
MQRPRPVRRDRHGRGVRGPLAWPAVPAMRTRSERFDDLVLDAVERIEPRAGAILDEIDVVVETTPAVSPALSTADLTPEIPLGEVIAASGRSRTRVVLYRRPIEVRAADDRELAVLVSSVLVEQMASLLSVDPHDLDPGYDDGLDDL